MSAPAMTLTSMSCVSAPPFSHKNAMQMTAATELPMMNMMPPMVGVPLFIFMPAGADLSNGLAKFDLVQKRHHEVAEQPCDDRRNDDCKAIQYNIHTL